MNDTPNLALPYILAAQAQKHVTHNEAIRALDCLVQLAVESRALTAPPPAPADGSRFVVGAAATGEWEGQSGKIAAFQDGAWAFYAPKEGWAAWVADEHALVIFDAGAWVPFSVGDSGGGDGSGITGPVANSDLADMASGTIKGRASAGSGHPEDLTGTQATALLDAFVGSGGSHKKGLVPDPGSTAGTAKFLREDGTWAEPPAGGDSDDPGGITELDSLEHVGINATGDTTNRLSLKSPASLFDNVGNGHQLKINKHAAGDTASSLYQTNFSGRAEMGLTGDDDFHFKVSPDGSTWHDAILIDKDTGAVSFPSTPDTGGGDDAGDTSALDLALTQLMLQVSDLTNLALFLGNDTSRRVADSFDTLTYVNTGGATNLDSSTTGVLKPSQSGGADNGAISQATGSVIGNMTIGGGNAAAFDGTTSQTGAASAGSASTIAYVGKDFTASPKRIYSAIFYGSNDQGFVPTTNPSITLNLYGKNGSAPTGPTDAGMTLLGTLTFSDTANESAGRTINSTDSVTQWSYVVGVINAASGAGVRMAELVLHEATAPMTSNMAVTSTAFTAAAPPTTIKGVIRVKEIDAATAGTDYTLEFSRDSGATWTLAVLSELFTSPSPDNSIVVCATNAVDVSGQPSGTGPMWRFKTLNNKNVQLYDAALYWI